jgi:hypothetical protein
MPKRIVVRPFTSDEQTYLEILSRSRKATRQATNRALILLHSTAGDPVNTIAVRVGYRPETVLNVVKRLLWDRLSLLTTAEDITAAAAELLG